MIFELFVIGLLAYGLVGLGIGAATAGARPSIAIPDQADAPIFVTRGHSRATTVTTRSGFSRMTEA